MKKFLMMFFVAGLALSLSAAQVYSVPEDERLNPGYAVEFDGYHNNLHVFADAVKEYALPPNVLRFGPGMHEIGIRQLKSCDTVYLDPGAVVFGGFHASNATNIAILG